jgi:outer membrane protein OmpA-like peptidoglycan-associated protein
MMRLSVLAVMAGLLATSSGAAWAVSNGSEVSVNPVSAGGGVLLYPGGQYLRVMRPLLTPGAKDGGTVQLHMPSKHVARARTPVTDETAAAVTPPPAPKRTAAPRRVATAAPAPTPAPAPAPAPAQGNGYNPGYGALGAPQGAAGLNLGGEPAASPPKRQQVAKAEPPPSSPDSPGPGMTKRSVILFAAGAADPAQSALGAIKFLAGDLNVSMSGPGSRIQILAYGGDRGDKGSDARRLSLKRALAIRQVLIDDGVASERIDVRAMGGADDGGPADRVDVYIKA